jgi:hypothetical protein
MKKTLAVLVGAAALVAGIGAQPAPAVVHEIYAAWCAGKGEIVPPGIADDTKQNFAAPVMANGVVQLTPFMDGVLIDFDFTKPAAKIVAAPTGPPIVQIGPGLYLERFVLDPNFPAFQNCPKLQSLSGV